MGSHYLTRDLTLPEALMAFLHNKDGQLYQSARPKQSTAAAELGELLIDGQLIALNDRTLAAKGDGGPVERPWMTEALAEIGLSQPKIDAWLRARGNTVSLQQNEAVQQSVLHKDRGKLAGLIGYDRYMVDENVRESLLAELEMPDADQQPRAVALAMLLATPALRRVNRLGPGREERIKALSSEGTTPLPGPLFTAMQYGIATAIGISILND